MKVVTVSGGILPTNCYVITDEATTCTAIVDPGFESEQLLNEIKRVGSENVIAILLTHGHFDHILGLEQVKHCTNAKIYIHQADASFLSDNNLNLAKQIGSILPNPITADVTVSDGDVIPVGNLKFRVLHTPGHTAGSCCYVVEDAIFSGDTLMNCCVGRTDFPTGSYADLLTSLKKINALQGDYKIYPGHEIPSTLEFERENNPYLRNCAYDFDY